MRDFVHLHVHTAYSLLDGACRVEGLIKRASELGQKAVAITDHGVMYGVMDFYKKAGKAGIKPIIGCEVYVARRTMADKTHEQDSGSYHLVLLCENIEGYKNLVYLCSMAFTEGMYIKPRVDKELLRAHSKGLICLSACAAGEVQRLIIENDYARAKAAALEYASIFGRDNYFLELQDHGLPEEAVVNAGLRRISRETGIPLVATNDVHYLEKEDAGVHDVLLCIQTGRTVDEEDRMKFRGSEYYLKSGDEMAELFDREAIENTVKIAERCHVEIEFGHYHLPEFPLPRGIDHFEFLREKCLEGFRKRYPEPTNEHEERLEYELSMIKKMGFVDYFLIVSDFVGYAKSTGVPVGPGRGSGGASIAAYCLNITDIDPMRYSLYFERFLNPERVSMPDIDIDFCCNRRQEVIDYVVKKYGEQCVSQIITFGTMAARGSIRDVGRALKMSYGEVDIVAKLVPNELHMTLDKALESSAQLRKIYDEKPEIKKLIDIARKVEGLPRNASTHAAGVLITAEPVYNFVPVAKNDDTIVTQYDMVTLEELGLLKIDFLGLRNVTILSDAVRLANQNGAELDLKKIDYGDEEVYAMLSRGDTAGVFQLESSGITGVVIGVRPRSIEDITAIIALYRPGPMQSISTFIECKKDPSKVTYKHPMLEKILSVTYGCVVYQEQVMEIFRSLAGYSLGRADIVRRAMSKKKFDVLEAERRNFVYGNPEENIKGCIATGVPEKTADEIFDQLLEFAKYAFNKSHSVCYAILAYQTAYMKCRYPREYMAALLNSAAGASGKTAEYIQRCRSMGIGVLPPDVNESYADFTVSGKNIRFGLNAIKNVGAAYVENVVRERSANGKYLSFREFCSRTLRFDLNRKALESMIKAGSFDSMGLRRSQLMEIYLGVLDDLSGIRRLNLEGQLDLFGSAVAVSERIPDIPEFKKDEILSMEKDVLGLYLSGHPMEDYAESARLAGAISVSGLENRDDDANSGPDDGDNILTAGIIRSVKLKTAKNNKNMAYVVIEDLCGSIEMLVFSDVIEKRSSILRENQPILASGRLSFRENEPPKLIVRDIRELSAEASPVKKDYETLYLKIGEREKVHEKELFEVLRMNPGRVKTVLYYPAEERRVQAPKSMWVSFSAALDKKLKDILPPSNVAWR